MVVGPPRRRRHSPAVTLSVSYQQKQISIDLVPVFQFPWDALPSELRGHGNLKRYHDQVTTDSQAATWTLVPKSASPEDDRTWRLSFLHLEKLVFKDRRNMKPGIRFVKWLRNVQGGNNAESGTWCHLSSFLIKTTFLWQDKFHGRQFWEKEDGEILVAMLRFLESRLRQRRLNDFWCDRHNLLDRANVKQKYWEELADRLKKISQQLSGPDPEQAVRRYLYRATQ